MSSVFKSFVCFLNYFFIAFSKMKTKFHCVSSNTFRISFTKCNTLTEGFYFRVHNFIAFRIAVNCVNGSIKCFFVKFNCFIASFRYN